VLSEDDVIAIALRQNAPRRFAVYRNATPLCTRCLLGIVDTLGSDHSPAPPSMKNRRRFFRDLGRHRRRATFAAPDARVVAAIQKRRLAPTRTNAFRECFQAFLATLWDWSDRGSSEANLAVVDLAAEDPVEEARLHYRHPMTPYAGRTLHGKVVRTLLRGQTIAQDGQCIGRAPAGRLIKPIHQ
jgi:allantoinase